MKVAVVGIIAVAVISVLVVAFGPIIAGRRNPRPADQQAEMDQSEPSGTSDDPGRAEHTG